MRFVETLEDEIPFDINVIPLIDVLLVILIFFMASASFVASGGIDVRLPKAATQVISGESRKLTVTVKASGELQLDGRPVGFGELRAEIDSALLSGSKPLLVVRADEKVEHGYVVKILDEARARGLTEIAIATVPVRR